MSTAIWGEPEFQARETYPSALLRQLLSQMIVQFSATGGSIALFNESIGQMEICLHLRVRKNTVPLALPQNGPQTDNLPLPNHVATTTLGLDSSSSALERLKRPTQAVSTDNLEDVTLQQGTLFPVGNTY